MEVYISGKISEEVISDTTRQKFARAEEMLKAKGHEVFNPTSLEWTEYLNRTYYTDSFCPVGLPVSSIHFYSHVLLRDLMKLSTLDAIYMLEDWYSSPGAKAELAFAMATKKKIFWQNEADSLAYNANGKFVGVFLPTE